MGGVCGFCHDALVCVGGWVDGPCVFAIPCPYAVGASIGCRCCDGGRKLRDRLVLAGESRLRIPAVRAIRVLLCVAFPLGSVGKL